MALGGKNVKRLFTKS